jgi:hypothetical protein
MESGEKGSFAYAAIMQPFDAFQYVSHRIRESACLPRVVDEFYTWS